MLWIVRWEKLDKSGFVRDTGLICNDSWNTIVSRIIPDEYANAE